VRRAFHALPFIAPDEHVLVGLPDTVWFPASGFDALGDDDLSFLCFPVERPEFFDAVVMEEDGNVQEVQVKTPNAVSHWIWGAFKLRGRTLAELHKLWLTRSGSDHYIGGVVNEWIRRGGCMVFERPLRFWPRMKAARLALRQDSCMCVGVARRRSYYHRFGDSLTRCLITTMLSHVQKSSLCSSMQYRITRSFY
jgi:hypothetical protein